jgi:hypothetical protein
MSIFCVLCVCVCVCVCIHVPCVLFPGLKCPVSDTHIFVSLVSRVLLSCDLCFKCYIVVCPHHLVEGS